MTKKSVSLMDASTPSRASFYKQISQGDWLFEILWDGYRASAEVWNQVATITGHTDKKVDLSGGFPDLCYWLPQAIPDGTVLDGWVTVPDDDGIPNYRAAQRRANPAIFFATDLPFHPGTTIERRAALTNMLTENEGVKISPQLSFDDAWDIATKFGLKGVLAKKADSHYQIGPSTDWIRIKQPGYHQY